jgi:hypothetical protein
MENICGMTGKRVPPEDMVGCNNAEGCDSCPHNDCDDDDLPSGATVVYVKWVLIILTTIICLLLYSIVANAKEIKDEEAVMCVIGEAEGEGEIGMEAVAEAIRNRGSLKGVYGCSAPRVRKQLYSDRILHQAQRAWERSAGDGDITFGATHWEGTAFKTPYWAKDMIVTATIGNQRFYKEVANAKRI